MASDWQRVTVADVAASSKNALVGGPFGSNLVSKDYVPSGIPVIRGQNMGSRWVGGEFAFVTEAKAKSLEANLARPRDLVFTQRGTLGQVALVPPRPFEIYLISQSQMKLTVDEQKADPLFLYYVFTSQEQQDYIRQHAIQTGVPHTNLGILRDTPILLPPIEEQRAIALMLGGLDKKIELNHQINETLESMARALFKSWFVDFDPVHAKAEGRDCGLPQPLADLFPASFNDSDVGKIPVTWSVKTAGEVSERIAMGPFGSSIKVETFVDAGVPVISGQHLHSFMLSDTTFNFITEEHANRLSNAMVKRGDVVFTHAGNIGQVALIPDESRYERYVISQRQFYMKCDLDQVSPSFVAFYFSSEQGQHKLLANTSSSGVPSIARPVSYLRSVQLPIPPRHVLVEFDRLIQPMLSRFRLNREQGDTLSNIRDALLAKLVSGELRIPDAERIVGEQI